jgi:hypothetical protein
VFSQKCCMCKLILGKEIKHIIKSCSFVLFWLLFVRVLFPWIISKRLIEECHKEFMGRAGMVDTMGLAPLHPCSLHQRQWCLVPKAQSTLLRRRWGGRCCLQCFVSSARHGSKQQHWVFFSTLFRPKKCGAGSFP